MTTLQLLDRLNAEYLAVHTEYERLYWISYMGDKSVDPEFQRAKSRWDAFRESVQNARSVSECLATEHDGTLWSRLTYWQKYFALYQTPSELVALRERITALENDIRVRRAEMQSGYIDPQTWGFVMTPDTQMRLMIATEPDEALRRACYDGREQWARLVMTEYIELVRLRNEYARGLGFRDFYAYKARIEEQMESEEIFRIFDDLSDRLTPFCRDRLQQMESSLPGVREPWNMAYMIAWDFTREEDRYYPIETVLDTWGRSFAALGIDYRGATMHLDLLGRDRKYNNGFCHMPIPVHYEWDHRLPARINFTCNAVIGQIGSGVSTGNTLFHEWGHAAHFAHMDMRDVCLNTEYAPMSTAWAETQSMFLDTLYASPEWKVRYAKTLTGEPYPISLYETKVRKTFLLEPLSMLRLTSVVEFERRVYSSESLDATSLERIAREVAVKYNGYDTSSLYLLTIPHIYSWSASCAYHGYGLATLALTQWREHLYDRYGYLVDNPAVGGEMIRVWREGASKGFAAFVESATGATLSPWAYIDGIIGGEEQKLARAHDRLKIMESVPTFSGVVDLNTHISVVDGTETIATNEQGFAAMSQAFRAYVEKRRCAK